MLNQDLYNRLRRAVRISVDDNGLGGGDVKVANQGEPMVVDYFVNPMGRETKNIHSYGETYRVCCPNCDDTRFRLSINHMWGVQDNGSNNYFALKCFNEGCERMPGFLDDLIHRLSHINLALHKIETVIVPQEEAQRQVRVHQPIDWPGKMVSLDKLPANHPGIEFLVNRGHNPKKLSKNYEVSWCENGKPSLVSNRITVPIYWDDIMVGWQARYIGDTQGDVKKVWRCSNDECRATFQSDQSQPRVCPVCNYDEKKPKHPAKWYTSPGLHKQDLFYNFRSAMAWTRFCVLVEGPMDVFRIGSPKGSDEPGPAMAVLGHTIGKEQIRLLRHWTSSGGFIFMMFDGDVWDKTIKQAERLQGEKGFKGKVIPVMMLPHEDPGDLDHEAIWQRIRESANLFSIRCPF